MRLSFKVFLILVIGWFLFAVPLQIMAQDQVKVESAFDEDDDDEEEEDEDEDDDEEEEEDLEDDEDDEDDLEEDGEKDEDEESKEEEEENLDEEELLDKEVSDTQPAEQKIKQKKEARSSSPANPATTPSEKTPSPVTPIVEADPEEDELEKPRPEPPYPGSDEEPDAIVTENTSKIEPPRAVVTGNKVKLPPIKPGEKIRGTKVIKHPYAKYGLVRITTDGKYIYRTNQSKKDGTISLRLGQFPSLNISNSSGDTFDDIYGANSPMLLFDYQKKWKQGSIGKIFYSGGVGLLYASGQGRITVNGVRKEAKEKFSLIGFVTNAGLQYRMHYKDKQIFIPYVEGGGDIVPIAEIRDDGKSPKFGKALAVHGAAGIMISLTAWDDAATYVLDSSYGINEMFLSLEGRQYVGLESNFDFTSTIVNLGLTMDF